MQSLRRGNYRESMRSHRQKVVVNYKNCSCKSQGWGNETHGLYSLLCSCQIFLCKLHYEPSTAGGLTIRCGVSWIRLFPFQDGTSLIQSTSTSLLHSIFFLSTSVFFSIVPNAERAYTTTCHIHLFCAATPRTSIRKSLNFTKRCWCHHCRSFSDNQLYWSTFPGNQSYGG